MKLEDLANKEFEITDEGLLKVVEKKTGKFVPKNGETYWFVDSEGYVSSEFENNEWFIKHNPVFRIREEVQQYKRYLDILDKYKHEFSAEEWINENIEKWHLRYYTNSCELDLYNAYTIKSPNCTYFKSKVDADAFIEEAGEENIKRFMFDVWE